MIRGISRDARLVFAARAVRMFCYGFLSVVLAVYLGEAGFGPFYIGMTATLILGSSALLTLLFTALADRLSRRRSLMLCAGLMAVSGVIYLLTTHPFLLLLAALTGVLSVSGGEAGVFLSVEQAILPQTTSEHMRTHLFGIYNMMGTLAASAGALFSGVPEWLRVGWGWSELARYKPLFGALIVAAALLALLFSKLSSRVEVTPRGARVPAISPATRGVITKLSLLFAADALAGGFVVQSLIALWFHLRFGVELGVLGAIFFGAGLLAALSFLVSARLAEQIGLVNTMVFTHIPSNLLLMAVPLAPTLGTAVIVFLLRQSISQMDVPTRQSYVMAVVQPEERTAAAGITNLSRLLAQATSPAISGYALQFVSLGLPFLLGGGLKILYDLTLLFTFRNLKPPEERL